MWLLAIVALLLLVLARPVSVLVARRAQSKPKPKQPQARVPTTSKCAALTLQPGHKTYVDGPSQFVAIGSLQPDTPTTPSAWNGHFSLDLTYRIGPHENKLEFQPPKVVLVDSQYAEIPSECLEEDACCDRLCGATGVPLRRVWHGRARRIPTTPTPVLLALQSPAQGESVYTVEITAGTLCFYY